MLFNTKEPENVGKFLSETVDSNNQVFTRVTCKYENLSKRFFLPDRQFSRQYAHIYSVRLQQMNKILIERAREKWGNEVPIKKLFQLSGDDHCIIIGTLYKDMQLKPNILREISEEHNLIPQPPRENFIDDSDRLVLEDDLQRIVLVGEIDIHFVVTGIVIAVKGHEIEGGRFSVEDYCYASVSEQISRPLMEEEKFVALVSGLGFGNTANSLFTLNLMADMLTGELGDLYQQERASKITRLIIAGNSLSKSTKDKNFTVKAKYLTKNAQVGTVNAVKTLDDFLVNIVSTMDVDIMSGDYDPCNYLMPQQPLHNCMFPKAGKYESLQCVTNPYEAKIGDLRFLGTSGQNVQDISRYSKLEDAIGIMKNLLEWAHIAPTAPDTLGCYPFYQEDPFVLRECPDVFFVGNQSHFKTEVYKGSRGQQVRLISLPSFTKSSTFVVVNLKTLECQPITFDDSHLGS